MMHIHRIRSDSQKLTLCMLFSFSLSIKKRKDSIKCDICDQLILIDFSYNLPQCFLSFAYD